METRPGRRGTLAPTLLLALGIACAHGSGSGPTGAGARTIEQIAVVPDFLAAWQEVRSAPRAEQMTRTRQALLGSHPELFGPDVFGPGASLDRDLDRSARRFLDEFPELAWSGPIASSLSFSHFESVWRTVGGRRTLVLGLDAIAFYRGPYAPLEPVVHHALAAALLPAWKGPGAAPLWWTLWEEAFPLAAVRTLDPGSSDADLRLTDEGKDPAYLAALARRVRGSLDSTKEADRRAITGTGGAVTSGGRWLALRVGQRVLAGRTLHDAARLDGPQLRTAIDSALLALERPGS
jgi:hypothetical protein